MENISNIKREVVKIVLVLNKIRILKQNITQNNLISEELSKIKGLHISIHDFYDNFSTLELLNRLEDELKKQISSFNCNKIDFIETLLLDGWDSHFIKENCDHVTLFKGDRYLRINVI